MEVEHQGVFKDVKTLDLSFSFNNAGFAVALPSENQGCNPASGHEKGSVENKVGMFAIISFQIHSE